MVFLLNAITLALFAADDPDTLNVSWQFLVFIGGVVTAVGTAVGAFLAKVLPALGQFGKDRAAAEAARRQAEAAATVSEVQAQAAIKREMYDKVYDEFKELLDRGEREMARRDVDMAREMARRDGIIEAQDARIDALYKEIRSTQAQRTECLIKNEQLMAQIMLLQARISTIETAEGIADVGTRVDPVVVVDSKGIVREWSPAATVLFHWRSKEIVGKSIELIIPPESIQGHRDGVKKVLDGKREVRRGPYRVEGLRRDGKRIPIEIKLSGWQEGDERYFTANIRPLFEGEGGELVPLSKLKATSESIIQVAKEIANGGAADETSISITPTKEGVTLNVPAGASAAVTSESVDVDVKANDKK
jgi:PAS domain S-box-containing protein